MNYLKDNDTEEKRGKQKMDRILKISLRFKEKLSEDIKWQANVNQVFMNVEDYFYCSPRFFPEYTHHGVLHIEKTLELCDKLIPDKCLEDMTSREAGCLIIAVIMHDIGMFIEEDGLKKLLWGDISERRTESLDNCTWKEAWRKYCLAVSRCSDKKLQRIFGKTDIPRENIKEEGKITSENILIYGEFLRRNHARLAHEIVKYGFPGKEDVDVLRNTEIDDRIRDIIGLIARSHGMKLRDVRRYSERHYSPSPTVKNMKIFYLMSVLRMADYLDAGYDRASHIIEAMKTLHSSISAEEFSWNQVIDYDDYTWDRDEESLWIQAEPVCTSQFLKIENWLLELQKELDLCWAVLGESYKGRSHVELTIRRINSNILEENTRKDFEEHFVTKRAVLDTNPDILKLLIYPLYNEESKYGIRELLQNAIDACNEREELERKKGNTSYQSQIRVEIDKEKNEFRITDNGLGMTENIIINYFLISGASFRNSDMWQEKFIEKGKSKVARTGKFGIGVLSAFLLGNYVEITTKFVDERLGYRFGVEIGRDNINIERIKAPVGTKLVIHSTKEILDEITSGTEYPKWVDWYCFQKPAVRYLLDGKEIFHEEEYVPNEDEKFDGWYRLKNTEYASYKWSYESERFFGIKVFCNGIPVMKGTVLDAEQYGFSLTTPTLSIVDRDNKVHINLARERLTEFPAEKEFVAEGYKFAIMRLLDMRLIDGFDSCSRALQTGFPYGGGFKVPERSQVELSQYLFSRNGYTLMSPAFLNQGKVAEVILVCVKSHALEDFKPGALKLPIWLCSMGAFRRRSFFLWAFTSVFGCEEIKEEIIQFMAEKNFYDSELKDYFIEKRLSERIELKRERNGAYDFAVDGARLEKEEWSEINLEFNEESGVLAVIRYRFEYSKMSNLMQKLLSEYFGDTSWIPYKIEERMEKYAKAFKRLRMYES